MNQDTSQKVSRFKNLDWVMARTVSLSILIGIMAAFAAKALLLAINFTQNFLHPIPIGQLVQEQGIENASLTLWHAGTLVILGLVVGLLTHYLMPNRMNRGLSHVIEDVHFNNGQTGVKEGLAVGLISAVSIGAGASVGRYGPAVHLGAAAASGVGTFFKLEDQEKLTLSCAGIAAAVSASFLAPLAAVIFVQEVVLRQWRLYQFIPTAAAAVAASETAKLLDVHFIIPSNLIPDNVPPYEFLFFGLIGVLSAVVGIAFNRMLPMAAGWVAKNVKVDNRLKPAIGGLILACIGFYFPSVLGLGGYETQMAVAGNIALKLCLILLVLKFVATIVSLAFGFNGGVFGPSLFMGAMIGASVGIVVEGAGIPISGISLYAIAGMGATVATVIGAVFAAIIAMIEMTGKLSPSLPVLFSVTSAYVVIYLFSQSSLLVNQLNGRNKNPFDEVRSTDKKYEGVKPAS
ncbi:MAG: CIC family chloride channel protein [Gammaproteobacteria bacterium]|jgi:CIC family chloride channel protein